MKASRAAILCLALALVLTACNEGNDEGGDFEVALEAGNEVCDGDTSASTPPSFRVTCGGVGSGEATIEINSDRNEVCYEFSLEGVENVNAAHIHAAPSGEAGDPVVDLQYDGNDSGAEACVDDIDESVLEEIAEEPERHYVNVHTDEYPDGAARAQLDD